jgi:hypothetical protein
MSLLSRAQGRNCIAIEYQKSGLILLVDPTLTQGTAPADRAGRHRQTAGCHLAWAQGHSFRQWRWPRVLPLRAIVYAHSLRSPEPWSHLFGKETDGVEDCLVRGGGTLHEQQDLIDAGVNEMVNETGARRWTANNRLASFD